MSTNAKTQIPCSIEQMEGLVPNKVPAGGFNKHIKLGRGVQGACTLQPCLCAYAGPSVYLVRERA
eukprot:1157529-Pelagomonas_calceolata.AAC.3